MANSITCFQKYIDKLDEVYSMASLTSDLDVNNDVVKYDEKTKTFQIPKMSLDGLADYSRDGGYIDGGVTLTYETKTPDYDRGRAFNVDAMDDDETAGVAFGQLSSVFIKTKSTPELDAYRFAAYAAKAGYTVAGADLTTGADTIAAIAAGFDAMTDEEVNVEGRILYITPTLNGLIRDMDTTKSREVMAQFAKVVVVPQSRFYTAIDLYDGVDHTSTSGADETAGHYVKASGAKNINFMIIDPSAIIQNVKHRVNKVITPAENQSADAYKFFFRAYGIADVLANKVKGVYMHKAATN